MCDFYQLSCGTLTKSADCRSKSTDKNTQFSSKLTIIRCKTSKKALKAIESELLEVIRSCHNHKKSHIYKIPNMKYQLVIIYKKLFDFIFIFSLGRLVTTIID